MKIGFTGTRGQITVQQATVFTKRIMRYWQIIEEFHHGGCAGADMYADWFVHNLHRSEPIMVVHPSNMPETWGAQWSKVKEWASIPYKEIRFPQDPLTRNQIIVESCELLYTMPITQHEVVRSGTWATIRYAESIKRRGLVIYPDGTTKDI